MSEKVYAESLNLLRRALNDQHAVFHLGQWEAIEGLVRRQARMLVVQRTGWGKSVVYFLATKLLRNRGAGPALLISPLLALMRNQISMAERLGLNAATINSNNVDDWRSVEAELLAGRVDILLISPERLSNQRFRDDVLMPLSGRIGLFVVDEAHCISDWGHDFRPDYRRIVRVLQALPPNIPVLATTATANDRVVKDVSEQLGSRLEIVRGQLARSSLRLQSITLPGQAARMAWLAENVPNLPGSGIIYTLTVKDAERVAAWLRLKGIDAADYHGDLNADARVERENRLLGNKIKALVATTALGMGFDKPDLGFVIHFQRPGSTVHYYQQVGRAGRAIDRAYGVLLCGEEDNDIIDYFIRTAFPPETDAQQVLAVLDQAEGGLSVAMIEGQVNRSRSRIEKILSQLAVMTPAPASKEGSRWHRNPVPYVPDKQRIEALVRIRLEEQTQMSLYAESKECLMAFLQRSLDDPNPAPCGRCAFCLGKPILPVKYSLQVAKEAVQFLRRSNIVIEERKQWPQDALVASYGWRGNIAVAMRAEKGRALCLWGDSGWGELVRLGKQRDKKFDQVLVTAAAEMVRSRWLPQPTPTWLTCVPSLNNPSLVPDFAERLAVELGLPFVPCVEKVRNTQPQKLMSNSYQQALNLAGAFKVNQWEGLDGPVLLIDDMVDSRWTFTVVAALLRTAGSGPVFPLALSMTTAG